MASTYFAPDYFGPSYFSSYYFGRGVTTYSGQVTVQAASTGIVAGQRWAYPALTIQSAGVQTTTQSRIAKGLPSLTDALSILDAAARLRAKTSVPLSGVSFLSAASVSTGHKTTSLSSLTVTITNGKRIAIGSATLPDLSIVSATAKGLKPGTLFGVSELSDLVVNVKKTSRTNIALSSLAAVVANDWRFRPGQTGVQASTNTVETAYRLAKTFSGFSALSATTANGQRLRGAFASTNTASLVSSVARTIARVQTNITESSDVNVDGNRHRSAASDLQDLSHVTTNATRIARTAIPVLPQGSVAVSGDRIRSARPFTFDGVSELDLFPTLINAGRSDIVSVSGVEAFAGKRQHTYSDFSSRTALTSSGQAIKAGFVSIQESSLFESLFHKIATGSPVDVLSVSYQAVINTTVARKASVQIQDSSQLTGRFGLNQATASINGRTALVASAYEVALRTTALYDMSTVQSSGLALRRGFVDILDTSTLSVIEKSRRSGITSFQAISVVNAAALRYRLSTAQISVQTNLIVSANRMARDVLTLYATSQMVSASSRIRYGVLDVVRADSQTQALAKRQATTAVMFNAASTITAQALRAARARTNVLPVTNLNALASGLYRGSANVLSQGQSLDTGKATSRTTDVIFSTSYIYLELGQSYRVNASIQVQSLLGAIPKSLTGYNITMQDFSSLTVDAKRIHVSGFNVDALSTSALISRARYIVKAKASASSLSGLSSDNARIRSVSTINTNEFSSIISNARRIAKQTASIQSNTIFNILAKLARRTNADVLSLSALQFSTSAPKRTVRTTIPLASTSSLALNVGSIRRPGLIRVQDISTVSVTGRNFKKIEASLAALSSFTANTKRTARSPISIPELSGLAVTPQRLSRTNVQANSVSGVLADSIRVRSAIASLNAYINVTVLSEAIKRPVTSLTPVSMLLTNATAIKASAANIDEGSDLRVDASQTGNNLVLIYPTTHVRLRRTLRITLAGSMIHSSTNVTVRGSMQPIEDSAVFLVGV